MKQEVKPLKSWQRAFVYLAAWLVVSAGLKVLIDSVLESLVLHILFMMIILPAATLALTFIYTRRGGLNPWLPCYLTMTVLIMYFFFGYNELSPNFIIENLICGFFGFGIGNVMKDESLSKAQYETDHEKKLKMMADEKKYQSLIDTDPHTGKKADLRKKNKEVRKK